KNNNLTSWIKTIGYEKKEKKEKDRTGREKVVLDTNGKPIMIDNFKKPIYEKKSSAKPGKSTLLILQLHHLVRYIACEKVNIEELQDPRNHYKGNLNNIINGIKEKIIDKDNTIIIFDEAHFPNTSYQVAQLLIIRMGYKVLLMSATFPKKDFSISTSKPREVYSI